MSEDIRRDILERLTELVIRTLPDASMRTMYGGTVIELRAGDPKSRIGGMFSYAGHITLELTNGAALDDLDAILEGSGKKRRHIKLRDVADITAKDCAEFLAKAAENC